jgi:hypothetical protein
VRDMGHVGPFASGGWLVFPEIAEPLFDLADDRSGSISVGLIRRRRWQHVRSTSDSDQIGYVQQSAVLCHVWTAPNWQGFSSRLQGGRCQPCVRPFRAVHMTAGPNALRGSGPNPKHAFEDAMTTAPSAHWWLIELAEGVAADTLSIVWADADEGRHVDNQSTQDAPNVTATCSSLRDCNSHRVKSQLRAGTLAKRCQNAQPSRCYQDGGHLESRRQGR